MEANSSSKKPTASSSILKGMYTQHLSQEVNQAVQDAIPTSDPLDRPVRGVVWRRRRREGGEGGREGRREGGGMERVCAKHQESEKLART